MVCRDGKGREKIKWLKDWSWPWRTRVTWQRIQPIIDTPASKAEGVHNLPSPRVDCDNTGHFVHKAIRKSCRENGLEDTLKNVSSFIVNYAEDNAIQLPRRIPGYKRTDLQLLPCSTTKRSVWEQYSVVAVQVGRQLYSVVLSVVDDEGWDIFECVFQPILSATLPDGLMDKVPCIVTVDPWWR